MLTDNESAQGLLRESDPDMDINDANGYGETSQGVKPSLGLMSCGWLASRSDEQTVSSDSSASTSAPARLLDEAVGCEFTPRRHAYARQRLGLSHHL